MTTAIIIDDHQMFSGGFKFILGSLGSIKNVISFENPQNAVEFDSKENVSLVVSDLYIPGYDMFVWIERLKATYKNAFVVVISSSISRTDRT
ncbi:response regulator, partial [Hellea sp.]|nr:response regulator [Hellea sp.]